MSRQALIVIDLQNDYFPSGKWPLEGIEAAADNAARLLAAARGGGDLIIHVRHEFPGADAPFFVAGSQGAAINDSVAPLPGEMTIVKNSVNAFRDTGLKAALDGAGVDEVTILGAMSHMCVEGAARAAADFGFKVTVVHDACATRDVEFGGTTVPAAQTHAGAMAAIGFAYAALRSTQEHLAESARRVA